MDSSNKSRRATRLKEKSGVSSDSSDLGRLFRERKNAEIVPVVPARSTLQHPSTVANIVVTAPGSPRVSNADTRTGTVPEFTRSNDKHTHATQTAEFTPPVIAQKSRVKTQSLAKKSDQSSRLLLMIAVVALGLWWFVSNNESQLSAGGSQAIEIAEKAAQQARIDFHRKMTGWKINRDRVAVDIANEFTAPPVLNDFDKKMPAPDIMIGLPLEGESNLRVGSHDRVLPPGKNAIDEEIMQDLKNKQAQDEIEHQEQAAYIKEFIANARKGGYDVHIDKQGNVLFQQARQPSSAFRGPGNEFHPEN